MPLRDDEADEANALTPTLSHLRVPRAGEGAARQDPGELRLPRKAHYSAARSSKAAAISARV
jgi:hypothetical protein